MSCSALVVKELMLQWIKFGGLPIAPGTYRRREEELHLPEDFIVLFPFSIQKER